MVLSVARFKELNEPEMGHYIGTLPIFLLDLYTITCCSLPGWQHAREQDFQSLFPNTLSLIQIQSQFDVPEGNPECGKRDKIFDALRNGQHNARIPDMVYHFKHQNTF